MKLLITIKREFLEILPPMIFFLIAFTLILATKRLILSEYGISWSGFGSALIGAYSGRESGVDRRQAPLCQQIPPTGS